MLMHAGAWVHIPPAVADSVGQAASAGKGFQAVPAAQRVSRCQIEGDASWRALQCLTPDATQLADPGWSPTPWKPRGSRSPADSWQEAADMAKQGVIINMKLLTIEVISAPGDGHDRCPSCQQYQALTDANGCVKWHAIEFPHALSSQACWVCRVADPAKDPVVAIGCAVHHSQDAARQQGGGAGSAVPEGAHDGGDGGGGEDGDALEDAELADLANQAGGAPEIAKATGMSPGVVPTADEKVLKFSFCDSQGLTAVGAGSIQESIKQGNGISMKS